MMLTHGGGTEVKPAGQCERRMRVHLLNEMLRPGKQCVQTPPGGPTVSPGAAIHTSHHIRTHNEENQGVFLIICNENLVKVIIISFLKYVF